MQKGYKKDSEAAKKGTRKQNAAISSESAPAQPFLLGRISVSVFVSRRTYLDRLKCEVSIVLLRRS